MNNSSQPNPLPVVFMVLGCALVALGAGWVYRPAALIVAGLMLVALAFLGRDRGGL